MTSLEETLVSMSRCNDYVNDKDKPGILFYLLPVEWSLFAIIADAEQMDYDSICEIFKDDAEVMKIF